MSFDFNQSGNNNKPEDMRNMIIFVVIAILLWLAYDHFIMKPRSVAMREAQVSAANSPVQGDAAEEKIRPRTEVLAEGERIQIDGAEVAATVSTTGIRFDDVMLKNYFVDLGSSDRVVLMSPSGTHDPHYAEVSWLADDPAVPVPGRSTVWSVKDKGDAAKNRPVVLTWDNGQGLVFERTISIDRHYMFTVKQSVTNTSGKAVTLYPYAAIARRGIPHHDKGVGYEGPMAYVNDQMEEVSYDDIAEARETSMGSNTGWIGIGQKYWLSAIIPDQTTPHVFRFSSVPDAKDEARNLYQVDVRGNAVTLGTGTVGEATTHIYVGAKKVSLLDQYEETIGVKHFDLAVDFGVLYFLTRPLYFLLNLFNGWVGNFGIAILMLTLVVRAAVFPLANKSYRSFAMLKKVSPKMAELKIKYGHDKPRMQQELVKLYETERVNPMAGCFPLLLQIPIFFAVYKVISISIEMRHAPFFGWIHDLSARDPLSVFNLFGLLPYNVPGIMIIGPWSIAMLILMLIQKHMNPPPQDQIQKDISNYMPWIMTFVLSSFPSGLVIYWTFSNLISVVQQYFIMRMMGVPVYLFSPEKAREYEASHSKNIEEAAARAREEVKKEKDATTIKSNVKDAEPVKESLFGEADGDAQKPKS